MQIIVNEKTYDVPDNAKVLIQNGKIIVNGIEATSFADTDVPVELKVSVLGGECALALHRGNAVVNGNVSNLNVSGHVTVNGSVGGDAIANGNITCADVAGNVDAGGNVTCKTVHGDVDAGGNVRRA